MEHLLAWLSFAACIALIGGAGPELVRSGDIIGAKTGLPGHWIGLALLATVTSLPELVTGVSSVTIAETPEIAIGDVFGSCVFNLTILALLDLLCRNGSVFGTADRGHVLSAGFGVLLIACAGLGLVIPAGSQFAIGHVGFYTPVLLVLYAIAMRSVFFYEKREAKQLVKEVADRYPEITLRKAVLRYVAAGAVVMAAGIWLPFVGTNLADTMGWQRSFVGTLFVAGVTSLPELMVSLAALRIGAADMAVANLLGSNLFDMAILAVDDILFVRGPILAAVSPVHAVSAFSAILMTGLAIVGLAYRPQKLFFHSISWVSIGLLLMYLINSSLVYAYG